MSAVNKLASAYVKYSKLFFGFAKYSSASAMLIQLNLPSFNTVLHNARVRFYSRLNQLYGAVIHAVIQLGRTN